MMNFGNMMLESIKEEPSPAGAKKLSPRIGTAAQPASKLSAPQQ